MVEIVNRPYAKAFEAFATARPEVLCLSADLTSSCEVDGFRDRHPDQFLSLGMAEQNMLSFAGGLAMLAASVVAGGLWNIYGPTASFLAGAAIAVVALIGLGLSHRRVAVTRSPQ